jgi:hypothetical protein
MTAIQISSINSFLTSWMFSSIESPTIEDNQRGGEVTAFRKKCQQKAKRKEQVTWSLKCICICIHQAVTATKSFIWGPWSDVRLPLRLFYGNLNFKKGNALAIFEKPAASIHCTVHDMALLVLSHAQNSARYRVDKHTLSRCILSGLKRYCIDIKDETGVY